MHLIILYQLEIDKETNIQMSHAGNATSADVRESAFQSI